MTGAWNAEIYDLAAATPLYRSLDATIRQAAMQSRARFANTLPIFNPGSILTQRARICALTYTCSKGDSHPTNAGYRAIAKAVEAAAGYPQR